MTNNQMPLPDGEEILSQAEAYRMLGMTRAAFRGLLDRGELRIADHKGTKGAARVARSEVLRFMADHDMALRKTGAVPAQPLTECRHCVRLQEEGGRKDETIRVLRAALAGATA